LTVCVERETLSTERERETLSYSHEVAANLNLTFSHLIDE
jgi:hypothetical protein